jgi:hypothetical protein
MPNLPNLPDQFPYDFQLAAVYPIYHSYSFTHLRLGRLGRLGTTDVQPA